MTKQGLFEIIDAIPTIPGHLKSNWKLNCERFKKVGSKDPKFPIVEIFHKNGNFELVIK